MSYKQVKLLAWVVLFCPLALSTAAQETVLEEIVVTATKRAASIQDVPIAVTAVDAETLERAGVTDLRDLSQVASSFNMNSSQTESQGTTLRIRGVGTTGNNIGLESAVGVFLDGVYLSRPGVALSDLMDVELIEVLRGPQGTLFGRNTSAGALNIRTKGPSFEGNEYFANVSAGNYDAINVQAGVSGPISDRTAYRLSAAWRQQDAFQESITGAETRDRDRFMLRGQLAFDPRDDLSIRIIADYSETDEQCCDGVVLQETLASALGSFAAAGLPANGGVGVFGDDAFDDLESNGGQFTNASDQWGLSVEANWDINDTTTLTYIAAYRDFYADSQQDDFVALRLYDVGRDITTFDEIKTFTQELRIAGSTENLDWLVGAYYSDETIDEESELTLREDYDAYLNGILFNFALAGVDFTPIAGLPLATGGTVGDALSAANPAVALAGGVSHDGAFSHNVYNQEGQSWSVFTHNTFHVTEALDLVVGVRWTDEEKDGSFENPAGTNPACFNTATNFFTLLGTASNPVEAATAGALGTPFALSCFVFATPADSGLPNTPQTFSDSFEDDELVYTGKVVYNFTDNISGYASYTHGFKAGGFNLDGSAAVNGADPRFDSEVVDAIELGLKADLLDRRLRANLAIFDYDIEDFQVLEFTGVQFQTFNVPNAESEGFEVELTYLATSELQIQFGYTYADSAYPSDCDDNDPNALPQASSLCGANFTNAPENVVTAGISYDTVIGDNLNFFASVYSRYEDDRRTSTQPNLDLDIQDSNTKTNLRIGLSSADERWMVELWGNNITDERTRNVTFNTPLRFGSRSAFLEAPRTYGITFRTRG